MFRGDSYLQKISSIPRVSVKNSYVGWGELDQI